MSMFLQVLYDLDASKAAEKMMFSCDEFIVEPHHILLWKKEWRLKLVDEDTFPEHVPCQVFVQVERFDRVKCMFFNVDYKLSPECYEEPLLNKNLLERSSKYGGLRIEMSIPLKNKAFQLSLTFEKVE